MIPSCSPPCAGLFGATGIASSPDARRRSHDQRRDLRHQAVADREQAVALGRTGDLHVAPADADRQTAQNIDARDDERSDDVALEESPLCARA